jgi:hypothetical protein
MLPNIPINESLFETPITLTSIPKVRINEVRIPIRARQYLKKT